MLQIIQTPTSTNINRFGWNGNLYIEFKKTRQVYEYPNMPETEFEDMLAAGSVGSHFHACIKKRYDARELPVTEARALGFNAEDVAPESGRT